MGTALEMKKTGKELKEKRVTSLLEEGDNEQGGGDDLAEVQEEMRSLTKESNNSNLLEPGSTLSNFSLPMSLTLSLAWIDNLFGITPTTRRGQNIYMACMLLVPLVPILALVIQNVTGLNTTIAIRNGLIAVEEGVLASNEMAELVSRLQEERSGAVLMMMTNLDDVLVDDIKNIGLNLNERFLATDESLDQIKVWRKPKNQLMFSSKLRFRIRLEDFRKKVIPDNETNTVDIRVEDVISFYNFATGTLLDELSALIKSSNGSSTWRPLITYKNILRAIENIGTEMSLGLRFIGRGNLSDKNYVSLIEQHKLSKEYMMQAETFASNLRGNLDRVRQTEAFKTYNATFQMLSAATNVTFDSRAELLESLFEYFRKTVNVMNQMRSIILEIREEIQAQQQININNIATYKYFRR